MKLSEKLLIIVDAFRFRKGYDFECESFGIGKKCLTITCKNGYVSDVVLKALEKLNYLIRIDYFKNICIDITL